MYAMLPLLVRYKKFKTTSVSCQSHSFQRIRPQHSTNSSIKSRGLRATDLVAVSLHPQQLQSVCYEMVRKDFFVERALGGAVNLEPVMTYRIEPAILYLTARKTPGFLKDYKFRAGSLEQVMRVSGPAGAASVLCVASKELGAWKIQTLVVEFESADIAENKRVMLLRSASAQDSGREGFEDSGSQTPRQRAAELQAAAVGPEMGANSDGPVLKLRSARLCTLFRARWV